MKIKTSKLAGISLDWAVQRAKNPQGPTGEGWYERDKNGLLFDPLNELTVSPSTDWNQGGPIVEQEGLWVRESATVSPATAHLVTPDRKWFSYAKEYPADCVENCFYGETYLIAAMRCFVASRLGSEVEVPDEFYAEPDGSYKGSKICPGGRGPADDMPIGSIENGNVFKKGLNLSFTQIECLQTYLGGSYRHLEHLETEQEFDEALERAGDLYLKYMMKELESADEPEVYVTALDRLQISRDHLQSMCAYVQSNCVVQAPIETTRHKG